MAIVQVKDATDSVLDWLVAKCAGYLHEQDYGWTVVLPVPGEPVHLPFPKCFSPSTRWAQGGTIIEREIDALRKRSKAEEADLARPNPNFKFKAEIFADIDGYFCGFGPTPLIAAMRCYVASKLGDTVEVPDELI